MSSKLNNFFNLCRLANVLLSVYCKLLIYVETATVLLHVETGIIFNCSLVYDMKTLCTPNKQTKYFQRKLVLTAHSYYQGHLESVSLRLLTREHMSKLLWFGNLQVIS